jgi:hypothetical protein
MTGLESLISVFAIYSVSRKSKIKLFETMDIHINHGV